MIILTIIGIKNFDPDPADDGVHKQDSATMACVYPISGTYGLSTRLLFYCLVLFESTRLGPTWAYAAALAYTMNVAATTAVHALLLVISRRGDAEDLDHLPAMGILSIAMSVGFRVAMLGPVSKSRLARTIFDVWFSLVIVGMAALSFHIATLPSFRHEEPICFARQVLSDNSTVSILLTAPIQVLDNELIFNCSYDCFKHTSLPFRSKNEILATLSWIDANASRKSRFLSRSIEGYLSLERTFLGWVGMSSYARSSLGYSGHSKKAPSTQTLRTFDCIFVKTAPADRSATTTRPDSVVACLSCVHHSLSSQLSIGFGRLSHQ